VSAAVLLRARVFSHGGVQVMAHDSGCHSKACCSSGISVTLPNCTLRGHAHCSQVRPVSANSASERRRQPSTHSISQRPVNPGSLPMTRAPGSGAHGAQHALLVALHSKSAGKITLCFTSPEKELFLYIYYAVIVKQKIKINALYITTYI
jgi:hypothetical protein